MLEDPLKRIAEAVEAAAPLDVGDVDADNERSSDARDRRKTPRAALAFDVERMNQEFAMVLLGSKAVIFLRNRGAPIEDQQRVLTVDAFRVWFANRYTEIRDAAGRVKTVTWAQAWLQSPERRSYRGIEFHPDPDNKPGTPGYLNLWAGFAVTPKPKPHGYSIFRRSPAQQRLSR